MVCCKGQCWRFGEYEKGGKKQEDEERGAGVFPNSYEEEEVPSKIIRWAEERDKLFFACVIKFETGG